MGTLELCSSEPGDVGPRNLLLRELVAYNGGRPIRVGAGLSGEDAVKGATRWFDTYGDRYVRYELRSVLPGQVVFDLGDCNDKECEMEGHLKCWRRGRAETHALWTVLNRLGIPYWGCPSGGKGIHTEVFGPPVKPGKSHICAGCYHAAHPQEYCNTETLAGTCRCSGRKFKGDGSGDMVSMGTISEKSDWRWEFSQLILGLAQDILGKQFCDPFIFIESDPVTIEPNEGSRLVREFGSGKSRQRQKSLWHQGPGPFPPLPRTRDEAYTTLAERGWPVPQAVPVSERPLEMVEWFRHSKDQAGGRNVCPRSIDCIYTSDPWSWGGCNDCPGNR